MGPRRLETLETLYTRETRFEAEIDIKLGTKQSDSTISVKDTGKGNCPGKRGKCGVGFGRD